MTHPLLKILEGADTIQTPSSKLNDLRFKIAENVKLIVDYDEEKENLSIDVINPDTLFQILLGRDEFACNVIRCELGVIRSIVHYYYYHYLQNDYVQRTISSEVLKQLRSDLSSVLMNDYGGYSPEFVVNYMYRNNLQLMDMKRLDRQLGGFLK